jgi:hypothetical protein
MAFIADAYFDLALEGIHTAGVRLDITSQEATTYTGATTTYTLGRKTSLAVGAPEAGAVSGRRVIVPAITDGSNATTGNATHWALTDGSSILIATGQLASTLATNTGTPWTCAAFSITLPDAVNE